jgi:protein SCO1/2
MFVKIVVVLLLLIVAASLLVQRTDTRGATRRRAGANLRPLMTRVALVLVALAAGVALVHLLTGCARETPSFRAQDITGADFARLESLDGFTDHTDRHIAVAEFRGKVVVVFFGYTQCPDICPTTLTGMKEAMRLLGSGADRVRVLFVTVDPERDSLTTLAGYLPWFDPRFIGLRADPERTRQAANAYKVFYAKANVAPGGTALGYSVDHTAESYAYDPKGRLRLKIAHGADPKHIAEDIGKLLVGQ